ncbi:MAG: hypothetical protein RJB38_1588 [Pseudomonadota bacterium]|jgi:hypothetical protein
MFFRAGWAIALFLAFHATSFAFSLDDHAQITRMAAQGLERCLPGLLSQSSVDLIIQSNQREDVNLVRKWTRYSHFYNPERPFRSRRLNSHDRIVDLEQQLTTCTSTEDVESCRVLLGKALHHVQDMASPPHVFPVNHLWTDGFEKLKVRISDSSAFSSCDSLLSDALRSSVAEIHQAVAENTWSVTNRGYLKAIRQESSGSKPVRISMLSFWYPGASGHWGQYGTFGNSFGIEHLDTPLGKLWISRLEYTEFKQSRLQAALRASQLVLARIWLLGFGSYFDKNNEPL